MLGRSTTRRTPRWSAALKGLFAPLPMLGRQGWWFCKRRTDRSHLRRRNNTIDVGIELSGAATDPLRVLEIEPGSMSLLERILQQAATTRPATRP